MDISEGLPVWVESCAAGDQGTGRCRLSRIALRALGLRPGDGVIVRPLRSSRLFLCAACLAPATSDIGRGEDFGARTGGNGAESVQVDGCIELPAAPLSLTAAPGANEPACGRPGSREHGETQGLGAVHAFRRSTAPAASVRLRANGFGGDPAARVRVAIASALNGHLVCQGAQLVIPEVGTIVVTETSPARCAVTIIARTRISFAPSSGPSSTPPPPPMDDHGITTLNTPSTPTSPPRCSQSPVDAPSTPPTSLPSHSPSQSPATVATASLHANMPLRALANHLPFSPASPMAPRSKPQVYRAQPRPTPEQTLSGAEDAICTLREVMTGMWVEQARLTGVGITPSKGVLVHGPRGTGKTALAQAMVEEFDAALLVVTAAEVSQGGAGEGEEVLRRVFATAEDSPRVVILLEDLDLMCPTREVGRDAQARVVAQLLLLMDGAKEAGRGVMWVGTTSQPNRVDGALRRPGRFDREVALAVPTQVQRTAILQRCLAQMTAPIAADVCLDSIARATVGFVGATIKALCAHAAAASILRQSSPRARGVQDGAPDATGVAGGIGSCGGQVASGREASEIGAQDFAKALVQVRHAALVVEGDGAGAGGENGVSQGLDAEIGGLEDVKTVLRQAIEWPLLRADRLRAFGVRPSRGVLLHGPPGCGKTSLVRIWCLCACPGRPRCAAVCARAVCVCVRVCVCVILEPYTYI